MSKLTVGHFHHQRETPESPFYKDVPEFSKDIHSFSEIAVCYEADNNNYNLIRNKYALKSMSGHAQLLTVYMQCYLPNYYRMSLDYVYPRESKSALTGTIENILKKLPSSENFGVKNQHFEGWSSETERTPIYVNEIDIHFKDEHIPSVKEYINPLFKDLAFPKELTEWILNKLN